MKSENSKHENKITEGVGDQNKQKHYLQRNGVRFPSTSHQ